MTEQVAEPQNNTQGTETGNQPNGNAGEHGTSANTGGGASQPQKTNDAPKETPVPEKYDLKFPDGTEANEAYLKSIADYAKENKLTNEQAQALLDRDINLRASIIKGQQEELDTRMTAWEEQVKSDGEIGGDNFSGSVEMAKRVVQTFATPSFIKALNETGLGNHPEVIRIFARVGKHLKDDNFVFPRTEGASKERSLEDVFYGDSNQTKNKEQ